MFSKNFNRSFNNSTIETDEEEKMIDRTESAKGLIQLEKGDPDNLAGPVIIYATVNGEITFREKETDQESQALEDLLKNIQIIFEEESDGQNGKIFPPGYCEGSEEDLETAPVGVDVVYAGEFSSLRRAELAMIGVDMLYKSHFLSQQERGGILRRGILRRLDENGNSRNQVELGLY